MLKMQISAENKNVICMLFSSLICSVYIVGVLPSVDAQKVVLIPVIKAFVNGKPIENGSSTASPSILIRVSLHEDCPTNGSNNSNNCSENHPFDPHINGTLDSGPVVQGNYSLIIRNNDLAVGQHIFAALAYDKSGNDESSTSKFLWTRSG